MHACIVGVAAGTPPHLSLTQAKILATEVGELASTVDALHRKCEELETSEKERFAAEEEKHAAEVAKLRTVNDQLKESLEAILAPPSTGGKKATTT
jgi:outer membrane murein-binding lipoprotein Lpp